MNILSLFDGISCGRVALERAGIKVDNYFASEIDKYAIQIAKKNYPDTIHIGSVIDIGYSDGKLLLAGGQESRTNIDMIIGGSPCQDLSIAKKDGKGLQGEKSGLFFEYVRLLKEVKPKYFLLENVASMKKADKEEITRVLTEVYPDTQCYLINSALVSAQNRKRLYWTNIPILKLEDKGIFIEDILDTDFDDKYWLKEKNTELLLNKVNINNAPNIACIDVYNKKVKLDRKCPTLTLPHHNSIRLLQNGRIRKLTPNECEKLQNVPLNYTNCDISDIHRYSMLGNGWTVDVIAHIFSYIK